VKRFFISLDSSRVAYVADPVLFIYGNEVFRLYSVPVGGPGGSSVLLSGSMVQGGDIHYYGVRTIFFTPNSRRVVYIADQDTDGIDELYVSHEVPTAVRRWIMYE
jgi:hypothetical protein